MDYITLFYCLSSIASVKVYVDFIKENSRYIIGDPKRILDVYLEYFNDRGSFPDFPSVVGMFGLDVAGFSHETVISLYGSIDNALSVLWTKFKGEVRTIELRTLENELLTEQDPEKKRTILAAYSTKLVVASNEGSAPFHEESSTSLSYDDTVSTEGIQMPIKYLNETHGFLQAGHSIVILAAPGSYKTTFALNVVFLNSVMRDKTCLYFRLEDTEDQYRKKVLSRYSDAIGHPIDKDLLLLGTKDKDDLKIIKEINDRYDKEKKGKVYYTDMAGFPTEPNAFANTLAHYVNQYEIDYVIFDYAQRMSRFAPARSNPYIYMNQFFSTLTDVAGGGNKNRKFSLIVLSQTQKEGIKKVEKSKGRFSIADAAEISALERDAFLFITLYKDQDLEERCMVKYQVLKARNGKLVEEPVEVPVRYKYCFLGDVAAMDNIITPVAVNNLFSGMDFDSGDIGIDNPFGGSR